MVLFWSGIALLLVLLGLVILPTFNMGLVGDDFVLVVPDKKLPLTQDPVGRHRPLQNAILRLAASQFGVQVLPYRVLIAGSYLTALVRTKRELHDSSGRKLALVWRSMRMWASPN